MNKTMDATKKLSDVIQVSIEEKNIEQLNLFLSSTSDVVEAFNLKTLLYLYRLLKKDAQHDVKCLHVSCVLSCLQHFLDSNIDPLIWEELVEKVSLISGLLFVISATFIKDDNIIERCTITSLEIVKISQIVANSMLTKSLEPLLKIVTSVLASNTIQLQILSHISCMLQNSSRETRWEVLPSVSGCLTNLSNYLLLCGDYETQVSVVEVLARCWSYVKEEHSAALFTNRPSILLYFNSYKFLNFDPECRLFLNEMNNSLGNEQLVYSLPCLVVVADGVTLKRPLDPLYKEFWVDFNTSTRSISFYYMPNPEENWELLNIEMENIQCIMARNSSGCKSREGKVIPAVKIDVTLKFDPAKPNLPQVLRIYPRKTHDFTEIEKNLSSKIFGDKYKSEVTYTDLPLDGGDTRSPKLKENPTAMEKSVATKYTSAHQFPEESDSDQSDIIGPSQILETKTSRKRNDENQATQQANDSDLSQSSQCSDTFTHYVKGLNKQNQTSIVINDSTLEGNETSSLNATVNPHKNKLEHVNKTENNNVVPEHTNSDAGNENFEIPEIVSPKKENNTKAFVSESQNEENISSCKTVSLKGQQLVSNALSSLQCPNQMNTQETSRRHVPTVQNNNCKRRHLYSVENMNTKDFIMSSQEDFSLEVPTYKLKKPEHTVVRQRGANKDNISFSYINFTEKHTKSDSIRNSNIFTDLNELDKDDTCNDERMEEHEKPSLKERIPHFTSYNDKKLRALNKTPENAKTSGLFPAKSVYSDFSSSGKDLVVKRTYARKKAKKGMKRIKVMLSSDSESDYEPHIKMPLEKEVALRPNHVREYVMRSTKRRVDPIRDMVCADEMEIEPMNLEEPDLLLAELSVGKHLKNNTSTAIKKEPKQKKNQRKTKNKKVESKKNTEKGKKGARGQIKKACSQKDETCLEEKMDDVVTAVPPVLDCVSYLPANANEILGFNDMALEMFNCTASQDIVCSQGSFKINDMIKFGTCCTLKVKNEIHKVQELLHKEREMNMAAFDFKVQSSYMAVQTQCQRLETINNNLSQIRVLLDSTYELQKDVITQIKSEATQLEITKQEVMKNLADMKESESNQINSEFKKMGEFMKNWILSYIPNRSAQN
uniref:Synaptonemal complex protein 2 Spt16M-like domain-containing protein n=1 Tax=Homalodisca liturata TaxID=320908 RepID=A0A1B6J196_9HEMI